MIPRHPPHPPRTSGRWNWQITIGALLRASARERGTVLLMVVGVLALLAIIGVVYATLGRADRSSANTRQRTQRINEQSQDIAAELARIVGDAVLAQYPEPVLGGGAIARTRGFTYPLTDDHFVSVIPANVANAAAAATTPVPTGFVAGKFARFDPSGTCLVAWPDAITIDPRQYGDPYLASFEPEFLLPLADKHNTANGANPGFEDRHDWRHISNFARSGNFVNLAILRPRDSNPNNGGFNAPSGFGPGHMSYGLTTFDKATGQPYAYAIAKLADGTTPANPLIPNHWDTNQIWAFRPAVPDTLAAGGAPSTGGNAIIPGSYEYLFNQWCDTDGDGFVDARWFELTDVSAAYNGQNSVIPSAMTARGRMRLFVAARCVDSSAMINVNTAADNYVGPGAGPGPRNGAPTTFNQLSGTDSRDGDRTLPPAAGATPYPHALCSPPPGLTPADIDLRRVLSLSDVLAAQTTAYTVANWQPYGGLPRPTQNDPYIGVSDYAAYLVSNQNSPNLGSYGSYALYDARWRGAPELDRNSMSGNQFTPIRPTATTRLQDYTAFALGSLTAPTGTLAVQSPFTLADELELRTFWGVNDSETLSRLEATLGGRAPNRPANLNPLRDNRSRSLEMSGRDLAPGKTFFNTDFNLGALTTGGAVSPSESETRSILSVFSDIRHLLTTYNGARPIKDGAVAADGGNSTIDFSTDVTSALLEIQKYAQRLNRSDPPPQAYRDAVQLIFTLYANALAPYTNDQLYTGVWGPYGGNDQLRLGLTYGGDPELALRMAAHMTANLIDAFKRDRPYDPATGRARAGDAGVAHNEPTTLTLELNNAPTNLAATQTAYTGTGPYAGPEAKLNASRLPPAGKEVRSHATYTNSTGWMNVYGVEAQPFITEFGAYFTWMDAPHSAGGDEDSSDIGAINGSEDPNAQIKYVTIKMEPKLSVADFLGEMIVFQINNPFDQDIVLFDKDALAANEYVNASRYYLEFAGRYYSFGEQKEDLLEFQQGVGVNIAANQYVLHAGETRTFYALNPGTIDEFGKRLKNVNEHLRMGTGAGSNDSDRIAASSDTEYRAAVRDWIDHQIGQTGINPTKPQQLTQVFPKTLKPVKPTQPPRLVTMRGVQYHDMDLWGDDQVVFGSGDEILYPLNGSAPNMATSSQRRIVHLWRTMRSPAHIGGAGDEGTATVNEPSNDLLLDRLRDPENSGSGFLHTLRNAHENSGDLTVNGAIGGIEGTTVSNRDIAENTGYTVMLWGAFRRPSDTTYNAGNSPSGTLDANRKPLRGFLPPWCMEARSDNDTTAWVNGTAPGATTFGYNQKDEMPTPHDQGAAGHYGGSSNKERFKKLRYLFSYGNSTAPGKANDQIGKPCPQKTSNQIVKNKNNLEYSKVAVEFHSVGEDELGGPIDNNNTKGHRSRNPALFSRSGDFLLPLAVGPWFDPSREGTNIALTWPGGDPDLQNREAQRLTLSEALALASGYYAPSDQTDPYAHFADIDAVSPRVGSKSDRGHLALDRFVPHLNPGGGAAIQTLGSGVPFALGIIDQFRAAAGVSSTPILLPNGTEPIPEAMLQDTASGGANGLQGKLNANTTPQTLLRTLPLVSPNSFGALANNPWMNPDAAPNYQLLGFAAAPTTAQPALPPLDANYSLALALDAYRNHGFNRELGSNGWQGNHIQYIREGAGFKSLGELAAVNFRADANPTTPLDPQRSMFRFAGILPGTAPFTDQVISYWPQLASSAWYDRDATGKIDTTTATAHYTVGAQEVQRQGGTQIPGGYQDKLAIVNALTNTASVRSDVFTVYFVVHGYTAEDCDIEDDQPLVPSVAKRFVMVVDRSNVVAKGAKPRILLLKEVPMP